MKLRDIISNFWGIRIKKIRSPLNGILEVWYISGRYQLDSGNANYSYGSLHRLFQQVFNKIGLNERNPDNLLLLGLGAGSAVSIVREELGMATRITGVEHDPLVIGLAKEFFNITRFSGLTIVQDDATDFLAKEDQKYDCIVIDLFHDQEVPEKFQHYSFINSCMGQLQEKGTIVFNFITKTKKQKKQFSTLRELFLSFTGDLHILDVFGTNRVIVFQK